jgi:hypothetical protein
MLRSAAAPGNRRVLRPLSDRELKDKFRDLAAYGAPGVDAGRVMDAIWTLDKTDNVADVSRIAAPTD